MFVLLPAATASYHRHDATRAVTKVLRSDPGTTVEGMRCDDTSNATFVCTGAVDGRLATVDVTLSHGIYHFSFR